MSLRRKFVLYLAIIHLPFAAFAVYLLLNHRLWLLLLEAFFALSLVYGIKLIRGFFEAVDRIRDGARLIADADFTSRFREVGHPEMDHLIEIYNRMADHLREERIRQQEQNYFLEKLTEASPLGVVTFDFDGRIVAANPSATRMLQATAERLAGRTLADLDTPFASALGELGPGESRVIALAGMRRVKCSRAQFLDRGFARAFITMAELTDELRQSEKAAYEKLIRMMSHEVNNTIAATNSILDSCLNYRDQLGEEDRSDYETGLRAVMTRAEQLNAFMRGFAEVVRLPQPKLSPCDVRALLASVAEVMRADARRRHIEWAWDVREPVAPVLMDRIQMEQVFVNVFKNAMEAIGEHGTITVRLGALDGRGYVIVEDTGEGIAPDVRSQIFTPFFSSKENGQGIGLTIVQEILARHGFDFSLDGPPGGPTRFQIVFDGPAARPNAVLP